MRQTLRIFVLAVFIAISCLAQVAGLRPNRAHNPDVPEALTIVIRPEGFVQQKIQVPAGLYAVGVFNRSGVDGLTLTFERVAQSDAKGPAAEPVASGIAKAQTARWLQQFKLASGTYRLRIDERPEWVCLIEVR